MAKQNIHHEPDVTQRESVQAPAKRGGAGGWLGWGLLSGFLAGIAFMALNCWYAASIGSGALTPFRTVATIVQGPQLSSTTIWIGMLIHSLFAALLGLIFAALLAPLRRRSAGWLVWAGVLYGVAIYLVDFQVLARAVPQFSAFLALPQPFAAATHVVFGALLAALILLAKPRAARIAPG
jgi:hypothetical protein